MFEEGDALDESVSISHLGEGDVKSELRVLEVSGFLRLDVIRCQESTGDVFRIVGGHRSCGWFVRVVCSLFRRLVVW